MKCVRADAHAVPTVYVLALFERNLWHFCWCLVGKLGCHTHKNDHSAHESIDFHLSLALSHSIVTDLGGQRAYEIHFTIKMNGNKNYIIIMEQINLVNVELHFCSRPLF